MGYKLVIDSEDKLPKVKQIYRGIVQDIEKGLLPADSRLPSINEFSSTHGIARDTVEKAYNLLKKDGYIISVLGKGFYTLKHQEKVLNVLMVLNKISSYKKEVYEAFINTLGDKAKVDLQIYHYDPKIFREIIESNIGKYHYYAIMPHFFTGTPESKYLDVIKMLPENALVLLDKHLEIADGHISVYQDFQQDILDALESWDYLFEKYSHIVLIFPELSHHPQEIITGIELFSEKTAKEFTIVKDLSEISIRKGQAFIVLTEIELAELIKNVRNTNLKLGHDIGILSFNETVLKELLDITVLTTNFKEMGARAAELILGNRFEKIRNNSRFILRKSL